MLSVRCQRDRLRSIMTRIHLAQDRTHTLDTFKVNILIITGIAVYINLSGQLTDHIRKFTRLVKHKLSRSRLQITAQDIHQKQLVLCLIEFVNLDLINTIIYGTDKTVIRRRNNAADTRSEITLCDRAKPLMEHTGYNPAQTAVLMRMYDRYLTIMVTGHVQILSLCIHRQVTSPHTIYIYLINQLQIAILQNAKYCYTLICNRIQILFVFGLYNIRRIVDRHNLTLNKRALLHIHVTDMNTNTAAMCVCPHIRYISFAHSKSPP